MHSYQLVSKRPGRGTATNKRVFVPETRGEPD
jgi:hypothetical protein